MGIAIGRTLPVWVLSCVLTAGCSSDDSSGREFRLDPDFDLCALADDPLLTRIHARPLHANRSGSGCSWSERPDGMSYLDINVHAYRRELRSYFPESMGDGFELRAVTGLGDEGLMTVTEGSVGVVVVRRGNRVLHSAPVFLRIEPDSDRQAALWELYGKALDAPSAP